MQNFIYTIRDARSEQDAIEFLLDILLHEYCPAAADEAAKKGFKRTFAFSDSDIHHCLNKMHLHSKNEFSWGGFTDSSRTLSSYTFWGTTRYTPYIKTGSHI